MSRWRPKWGSKSPGKVGRFLHQAVAAPHRATPRLLVRLLEGRPLAARLGPLVELLSRQRFMLLAKVPQLLQPRMPQECARRTLRRRTKTFRTCPVAAHNCKKAAAGRAKGKARASKVLSGAVSAERREYEAATRLQVWWHQWMRRCVARRERQRMIQERLEEQQEREERAARAAAAAAALEAQEKARREADARREAELRAFRDRRSVVEVMCQGLPSYTMPWEEEPSELVAYLEQRGKGKYTAEWLLGRHSTKKAARRRYLELARKWHPDKWAQQGEASVAVATDLTKCLVLAYEQLMKDLPQESSAVSCEDDDEDREVCEFASWVGVSFVGMKEVYAERKGVKR
eukprot:gnl/TRDRNA2_/TRDRNA2_47202_c0_seq1.p1 gnl/TRDRNA2_/TRDRNA2_47202_c0~~gnl/TRDRNA2_/TRDRNA2_47202_c0_seq1.p1  ORF type:complete len:346 (-),score=71.12 gnl/TRDRNA2_/TRDRNA2_47202_c0_seq1:40-1077(-)